MHNYGPMFDGDIEKIRSSIRYYTGSGGDKNRKARKIGPEVEAKLPQSWIKKRYPYRLEPGFYLLLADTHVPYHSKPAIEAAIKYGHDRCVDGVVLLGDVQDCASVGFWETGEKRDFDKELESTLDFLDFIKNEFSGKKLVYKRGNHELRLDRYYQVHAPEITGIPLDAMDDAYGLDYRGYDVVDDKQMILAGKLPVFHGHEFGRLTVTVNPARGLFMKAKSWALCAHCHRTSEHPARNIMGVYLTTWSVGCLCDLSPDYNPFGNDWNWGCALLDVEKNGNFTVENRRILPSYQVV